MNSRRDDAPDLTVVAAADVLLDALGRGESAPDDDALAGLLAAWRADLGADPPADFDVAAVLAELPAVDEAVDDEPADGRAAVDDTQQLRPAVPDDAVPAAPVPLAGRRARVQPGRRMRRYVTGMAAALLLIAGLAVGAGYADPDSPLWPITRLIYPERSDLRLAEHSIDLAREAAADGRYADARRTLDRAAGTIERIDDPKLADRLRNQVEEIRRSLPPTDDTGSVGRSPGTPAPSTSGPTPAPSAPASSQAPPAGGQPGGGDPGGGDPGGGEPTRQPGGGIIPGLPTPTQPIPLPTITIPGLPLNGTS